MVEVGGGGGGEALRKKGFHICVSFSLPPPPTPLLLFPSDKANRSTFTLPQREARWREVAAVAAGTGSEGGKSEKKNPQGPTRIGGKVWDKRATVS